jgi:hypothetical protein
MVDADRLLCVQLSTERLRLAIESIDRRGDEVEFAWLEEEVVDQKVQAEVVSTLVGSGIITINQAREKLGEEPDPNPAANTLMAMTKTGLVPVGVTTPEKETSSDDISRT